MARARWLHATLTTPRYYAPPAHEHVGLVVEAHGPGGGGGPREVAEDIVGPEPQLLRLSRDEGEGQRLEGGAVLVDAVAQVRELRQPLVETLDEAHARDGLGRVYLELELSERPAAPLVERVEHAHGVPPRAVERVRERVGPVAVVACGRGRQRPRGGVRGLAIRLRLGPRLGLRTRRGSLGRGGGDGGGGGGGGLGLGLAGGRRADGELELVAARGALPLLHIVGDAAEVTGDAREAALEAGAVEGAVRQARLPTQEELELLLRPPRRWHRAARGAAQRRGGTEGASAAASRLPLQAEAQVGALALTPLDIGGEAGGVEGGGPLLVERHVVGAGHLHCGHALVRREKQRGGNAADGAAVAADGLAAHHDLDQPLRRARATARLLGADDVAALVLPVGELDEHGAPRVQVVPVQQQRRAAHHRALGGLERRESRLRAQVHARRGCAGAGAVARTGEATHHEERA